MGLSMVKAAHAAGATVVVLARDAERLDGVVQEAAAAGATIHGIAAELAVDDEREAAFERVVAKFGRIDGLVNNAGITKVGPSADYHLADFRRILEVNVAAVFACSQAAVRAMPDGGSIVNTASLSSFIGQPERAAYVASKTAVLGLTRSLAVEWGPLGVRVNAIAPGYIETDLTGDLLRRGILDRDVVEGRTPLRRFGMPDDVAGATLFLLSDLSSFVSGATLSIDGGWLANGYIR
jgi:NAD(P)-dependent dehydrogenase (short-subunit alcohol dehydrogenase family)